MIGFSLKTNQLESAFKKLSDAVGENALRAAGAAGAALLRDEAKVQLDSALSSATMKGDKPSSPTGKLRDNIIIKRLEESAKGNESQTYIVTPRSKPAFYWRFLEFGTVKMPARPFMRPAFDAQREDALNKMREVLKVKLKEALK